MQLSPKLQRDSTASGKLSPDQRRSNLRAMFALFYFDGVVFAVVVNVSFCVNKLNVMFASLATT
eukprot:m.64194 g.64194  ORF g.64194 m.64194 type:complete len:64 (-) comp7503_c0_seq3:1161-1352(-)